MRRTNRQLTLPSWKFSSRLEFSCGRSNPKGRRPIATKQAIHLVMRSTLARGERSFLKRRRRIENLVRGRAAAEGIRVYDFANVGNHLHIVMRVPSHRAYKAYVRALSGLIARQVLGAEKGRAWKGTEYGDRGMVGDDKINGSDVIDDASFDVRSRLRFWDTRPYTRIVAWGRDYAQLKSYVELNRAEGAGVDRATAAFWLGRFSDHSLRLEI